MIIFQSGMESLMKRIVGNDDAPAADDFMILFVEFPSVMCEIAYKKSGCLNGNWTEIWNTFFCNQNMALRDQMTNCKEIQLKIMRRASAAETPKAPLDPHIMAHFWL